MMLLSSDLDLKAFCLGPRSGADSMALDSPLNARCPSFKITKNSSHVRCTDIGTKYFSNTPLTLYQSSLTSALLAC